MRTVIFSAIALVLSLSANAQDKYFTKDGYIRFFSTTSVENIEGINKKVTAILDEGTGNVEFSAIMKSFEFEKALMEEHFNENYVESNTYPKAKFKGAVVGFKAGSYGKETKVTVKGTLEIHGVSKEVEIPGTLLKTAEGYDVNAKFNVVPEDYKITIPSTVRNNIAKQIEVTVKSKLILYTK